MSSADLELCYMPAAKQLEGFRARELSPVEVLRAQISRAEAVGPAINAFSHTFFEQALDQARVAEAVYSNRADEARPLDVADQEKRDATVPVEAGDRGLARHAHLLRESSSAVEVEAQLAELGRVLAGEVVGLTAAGEHECHVHRVRLRRAADHRDPIEDLGTGDDLKR